MSTPYYDAPTPETAVSTAATAVSIAVSHVAGLDWPPPLHSADVETKAAASVRAPGTASVGVLNLELVSQGSGLSRVGAVAVPDLQRVSRAHANIPLWMDEGGNVVCPYCGRLSCSPKCLLHALMESVRTDLKFLEEQHALRSSPPPSAEDKTSSFQKFCSRPDVLASISGNRLFTDFVERYQIVDVVAEMGPWLFQLAQTYANTQRLGVEMPLERLKLRAERAVVLFLKLELSLLTEEDAWILQQVIESCGSPEQYEPSTRSKIQAMMDLLTVLQAYFDHKGKQQLQRQRQATHISRQQIPQQEQDDPNAPRRCKGRTQSGVRCKLTEESVTKLHGRCAEAAQPLAQGEDYCSFHREQQFHHRR